MLKTIAECFIGLILAMVLSVGIYEIILFWKHIILNKPIKKLKKEKGKKDFDDRPIIVQLNEVFGKKDV